MEKNVINRLLSGIYDLAMIMPLVCRRLRAKVAVLEIQPTGGLRRLHCIVPADTYWRNMARRVEAGRCILHIRVRGSGSRGRPYAIVPLDSGPCPFQMAVLLSRARGARMEEGKTVCGATLSANEGLAWHEFTRLYGRLQ